MGQGTGYTGDYPYGTPATQADIDAWNKDVRPDGMGLPAGSGTFEKGQKIYAEQCAMCHGDNLEGIRNPNLPQGGGPALIGGRGTLNTPKFKITVESYWPYATTLYDYILRAMPYTAPSSLKPDEVYSLVGLYSGPRQHHRQKDGDGRQIPAQGADAQPRWLLSRQPPLSRQAVRLMRLTVRRFPTKSPEFTWYPGSLRPTWRHRRGGSG